MEGRKSFFNEAAGTWDERFYTAELAVFLEKLVSKFGLKLGQNVLDVGTGTGLLIPFLLKAIGTSGSITAIDYAEKMVQICKSKHSHKKNVTIILQDVEELDLQSASFDIAVCFGLFPHLAHKERTLLHLKNVLKHGGKLIIAHALSSAEIKAHHNRSPSPIANDVLPEKLEMWRMLKRVGFTRIFIKDKPGCYLSISIKP